MATLIPERENTTKALIDAMEFAQRRGNTIGMGSIGDECDLESGPTIGRRESETSDNEGK